MTEKKEATPGRDPKALPTYEDLVASDLRDRLKVDANDLERELAEVSAQIAYIGGLYARAIDTHLKAEVNAKRARAITYISERVRLQGDHGSGRGGATEALINAHVANNSVVRVAEDDEINAQVVREEMKTLLDAIKAKRDALIQIAGLRRSEMQLDPSFRQARIEEGKKLMGFGGG